MTGEQSAGEGGAGVFRIAQTEDKNYLSYTVEPHSVVSEIWPEIDREEYEMHDVELTEHGAIRVDIETEKGRKNE